MPFPTELPPDRVIDAAYQTIRHDLSPLSQYHFEMTIPKDWQTLDTTITADPTADIPQEVGAFREPGAWMKDAAAPVQGEVTVTVLRASGSVTGGEAARMWLKDALSKTIPGFRLLQERTVTVEGRGGADMLLAYGEGEKIVARFWAMPTADGSKVFVVIGSAPKEKYPAIAEQLFTALATFRLLPK